MQRALLVVLLAAAAAVLARPLTHDKEPDGCTAAMIGDKRCQLACHHASTQWDGGDCADLGQCDEAIGTAYLQRMIASNTTICTPPTAAAGVDLGAMSMTYTEDGGCSPTRKRTNLVQLRNVVLTFDAARGQYTLTAACDENSGLGLIDGDMLGPGAVQLRGVSPAAAAQLQAGCAGAWVAEPTVLAFNPRHEWLNNMFHATEEFFALFQLSYVLDVHMRDLRFVFARAGAAPVTLQLPGQLDPPVEPDLVPFSARPQIFDVYDELLARGGAGHERKFAPLPPLHTAGPLCFRAAVLPTRACHGEVLSRSFFSDLACPRGSSVARAVADGIYRAYDVPPPAAVGGAFSGATVQVTVITRGAHGGRPSLNMPAVVAALRTLGAVFVHEVLVERLGMREQLELFRNTDVLVGPHGAGLTNVLYLQPGAALVEFTDHHPPLPHESTANIFMKMAEFCGVHYANVQGAAAPDPANVRAVVEAIIARGKAAASAAAAAAAAVH